MTPPTRGMSSILVERPSVVPSKAVVSIQPQLPLLSTEPLIGGMTVMSPPLSERRER